MIDMDDELISVGEAASRLWEKTAIDCLAYDGDKLHTEVFRVDDAEEIVSRAERFFALMPALDDMD